MKLPGVTLFDLPSLYQSLQMCIIQIYFCIVIKHGLKMVSFTLSYTYNNDIPKGIII